MAGSGLEITSAARSDLFVDPIGETQEDTPDVERLVGQVAGPFQLSAKVTDDANSWDVAGSSVFLRVSRTGRAFALHSSDDGQVWQLVRVCALGIPVDRAVHAGFLAQSPNGEGCRAVFEEISFTTKELGDIRDGS